MEYLQRESPLKTPDACNTADLNSWTYLVRDAPRYPIGHSINLGAQIIVLCLASFGIAYNIRENRVRDAGKRNHRLEGLNEQQKRDLGHHHPDFRYIQ